MYGGDEFSAKVSGHDLKSLVASMETGIHGISFPLMAVVSRLIFCLYLLVVCVYS
jgi:hypothetical protein